MAGEPELTASFIKEFLLNISNSCANTGKINGSPDLKETFL